MGMNVGSGGGENEVMVEMNTTPLIDVMLVLLIMLIITIPVQTHAVKLDLPINQPPTTEKPQVVDIELDFDGTITWNGTTINSRAQMDDMMRQAAAQAVQPEIQIRPNKLVKYRYVAEVLADAQSIGLNKIGVVGNEQYVGND
jgi:biopolymer transport protein ExbD